MTLVRSLAALILVLAIAGSGGWYLLGGDTGRKDTASSAVAATKDDIEDVVLAQGKLEPKTYVDVGTQVSGQLEKLHVAIGDPVKQGDLLAEIDPQVYQSKVDSDQAALKSLQAQIVENNARIDLANAQYRRNLNLYKIKAVSQDVLQTAQSQLKVYRAQLATLQAQIEQQQSSLNGDLANLGYTKIYAPMSGTVVSQSVKEGQTVNASQSAPVIVTLADLDIMTVRAQVAEADIGRLKEGMSVWFTTLGSTRRRDAKINQILPTPVTVNDVVLYDALVDAENKDRTLMTGMSTQMFFVVASVEDALTIPVTALGKHLAKQDDATGQAYRVTIIENGTKTDKVVRVGIQDRAKAEIKSGLKEGDQIVLPVPKEGNGQSQSQNGPGARAGGGPRL